MNVIPSTEAGCCRRSLLGVFQKIEKWLAICFRESQQLHRVHPALPRLALGYVRLRPSKPARYLSLCECDIEARLSKTLQEEAILADVDRILQQLVPILRICSYV